MQSKHNFNMLQPDVDTEFHCMLVEANDAGASDPKLRS